MTLLHNLFTFLSHEEIPHVKDIAMAQIPLRNPIQYINPPYLEG